MSQSDRQRFVKVLRARHTSVTMVTGEEDHALNCVVGAAVDVGRPVMVWSVVRGLSEGLFNEEQKPVPETQQPAAALRSFALGGQARVLVLLDLTDHLGSEVVLRTWRETLESCHRSGSTLVLIDHRDALPPVVAANALRFELSLPDEQELLALSKEALRRLKADERIAIDITAGQFASLVRNLRGLTRRQAEQVIRDAAVAHDRVDAATVDAVVATRHRLLDGHGLLEVIEIPVKLDQVAGVQRLKRWLHIRSAVMASHALPVPGLEAPRGVLLLGVPGSGKSLCAKAIATAWGLPLLRLDAGVLYDRYVGESERRLREALHQAESMAPAVLWIDEIEKAFASASSRSSDGGLSQRMFGSLLTWMQERPARVFLVATANDIEALPPELLRKGRLDEIFFVDLPGEAERAEIFRIHLHRRGRNAQQFDTAALAAASQACSGAEIEEAINSALYDSFYANQEITTEAVLATLTQTVPLARTMDEQINRLRHWAEGRARNASVPRDPPTAGPATRLDL